MGVEYDVPFVKSALPRADFQGSDSLFTPSEQAFVRLDTPLPPTKQYFGAGSAAYFE